MAEFSAITWTDHTFNPWIGCTKVGPGCDHCYAERDNGRRKWVAGWGSGVPRKRTSAANWRKPILWNRDAEAFKAEHGHYPRVFAASLADIFDNEVPDAWRDDFWALVRATPKLQWLIVTKRIGNARRMLPADWGDGYPNVVLIVTVVNQDEADRDVPKLLATPVRLRGLSVEPILGAVDVSQWLFGRDELCEDCPMDEDCACGWMTRKDLGIACIDWVIAGGESGTVADVWPVDEAWLLSLEYQCRAASVAFHMKQMGALFKRGDEIVRPQLHHAGAAPQEWTPALRVRQFPPQDLLETV